MPRKQAASVCLKNKSAQCVVSGSEDDVVSLRGFKTLLAAVDVPDTRIKHSNERQRLLCAVSDLVKHVVKDYRNIYPEILKRAARTFDQVCRVRDDRRHDLQVKVSQRCALLLCPGVRPEAGGNRP